MHPHPQLPFDPDFQLVRLFPEPRDDLERTTPVSIPKSFCLAVESAGFAASSLALQDLESQPADEIYECLETLAGQKWSDRLGFWNLIKERIVSAAKVVVLAINGCKKGSVFARDRTGDLLCVRQM